MTWVLLTFIITTGLYMGALVFALHRAAKHLQGRPEAVEAVTEHVLVPLLGKWRGEGEKTKPSRDARH